MTRPYDKRRAQAAHAKGLAWVTANMDALLAAGWTRAELLDPDPTGMAWPWGWGLAWSDVWLDKLARAPKLLPTSAVEFAVADGGGRVVATGGYYLAQA